MCANEISFYGIDLFMVAFCWYSKKFWILKYFGFSVLKLEMFNLYKDSWRKGDVPELLARFHLLGVRIAF